MAVVNDKIETSKVVSTNPKMVAWVDIYTGETVSLPPNGAAPVVLGLARFRRFQVKFELTEQGVTGKVLGITAQAAGSIRELYKQK